MLFKNKLSEKEISVLFSPSVPNHQLIMIKHIIVTQQKTCSKLTKRCPNKKTIPSSYKRVDYEFHSMKEKDLEMEQLMASMKDAGMVRKPCVCVAYMNRSDINYSLHNREECKCTTEKIWIQ